MKWWRDKFESETNARFDKVDARFDKLESRLDLMNADMRQFCHLTGKLEAKVENLEKKR
jgi:hypothetical protein